MTCTCGPKMSEPCPEHAWSTVDGYYETTDVVHDSAVPVDIQIGHETGTWHTTVVATCPDCGYHGSMEASL